MTRAARLDGTVTRRCDTCRSPLQWDSDKLEDHLRRLALGEHVACACDDDHAAAARPWTRRRLQRALDAAAASWDETR